VFGVLACDQALRMARGHRDLSLDGLRELAHRHPHGPVFVVLGHRIRTQTNVMSYRSRRHRRPHRVHSRTRHEASV
jgi:hypothetical protein